MHGTDQYHLALLINNLSFLAAFASYNLAWTIGNADIENVETRKLFEKFVILTVIY